MANVLGRALLILIVARESRRLHGSSSSPPTASTIFLGATGRIVLTRLLGLILAALAVQFVADGVLAFARAG